MSATLRFQRAIDRFLELALSGESPRAVAFVLNLLDDGELESDVIDNVLAAAQRQVGDRWQCDELSVADEHLASGAVESTLFAMSSLPPPRRGGGSVVVACAEGDWHSIAAHMVAEQLRCAGLDVTYLGASTPAREVARFLGRRRTDALAVSCNICVFYSGLARLAEAAHGLGVPVIAGGNALRGAPHRARRLGVDAHAEDWRQALEIVSTWREDPPVLADEPIALQAQAGMLESCAEELAESAFRHLLQDFSPLGDCSGRVLDATRESLAEMVRFIAAAELVEDEAVLTDSLTWLAHLYRARGLPITALHAALESLVPPLQRADPGASLLADAGLEHLEAMRDAARASEVL